MLYRCDLACIVPRNTRTHHGMQSILSAGTIVRDYVYLLYVKQSYVQSVYNLPYYTTTCQAFFIFFLTILKNGSTKPYSVSPICRSCNLLYSPPSILSSSACLPDSIIFPSLNTMILSAFLTVLSL